MYEIERRKEMYMDYSTNKIMKLEDILNSLKKMSKKRVAVAVAEDLDVLFVVEKATSLSIAEFVLIGDKKLIKELLLKHGLKIDCEIYDETDHLKAAEKAVSLVSSGEVDTVMKGLLHTSTFLKAVLNKENGLNKGGFLSQISVFEKEYGDGLQLATDCAMAIEPVLEDKKRIIENAVYLARKLGYSKPKVALLSALETINPAIKDTLEAAVLSKMSDRKQIKNVIIDGPLALDNAISKEAAEHKGIKGEVAGHADVLVVPNLQVGNVLHKSLSYFAHKNIASAIVGASIPIIMTSRTDSVDSKLYTIALACYVS